MRPLYCIFLILFSLSACTQTQVTAPDTHPVISPYSQAWNDKDLETMSALMHPDIEWISVNGIDIKVEISGKDALVKEMQAWFEGGDLPTGSLAGWSLNGDYVAVTETAAWTTDQGEARSQSALTVYQLENDRIRRVYYYPATKGKG